jgi:hypothetical protein
MEANIFITELAAIDHFYNLSTSGVEVENILAMNLQLRCGMNELLQKQQPST